MRPAEVVTELGKGLQKQRLKINMMQAELAQRTIVSLSTISSLENGKNTTFEIVIKVLFASSFEIRQTKASRCGPIVAIS